jgi:hypothetical protein
MNPKKIYLVFEVQFFLRKSHLVFLALKHVQQQVYE